MDVVTWSVSDTYEFLKGIILAETPIYMALQIVNFKHAFSKKAYFKI